MSLLKAKKKPVPHIKWVTKHGEFIACMDVATQKLFWRVLRSEEPGTSNPTMKYIARYSTGDNLTMKRKFVPKVFEGERLVWVPDEHGRDIPGILNRNLDAERR